MSCSCVHSTNLNDVLVTGEQLKILVLHVCCCVYVLYSLYIIIYIVLLEYIYITNVEFISHCNMYINNILFIIHVHFIVDSSIGSIIPIMYTYYSSSLFRREAGIAHSHAYRNN